MLRLLAIVVLSQPFTPGGRRAPPETRRPVVTIGDSILAGAEAEVEAELDATRFTTRPCAAGGSLIADCVVRYAGCGAPVSDPATGVKIVVAWNCGINNIVQAYGAAATWAAAESALNAIRAQGVRVAVVNLTPCAGYSGCDTTAITTYNASLAAWCTAQGAAYCQLANANAVVRDANNADALSASCDSGDHLHLTGACEAASYAPAIANAVEAL